MKNIFDLGYGGAGYDAGYYNQYNSYWSNMAAWQQYNQYYQVDIITSITATAVTWLLGNNTTSIIR